MPIPKDATVVSRLHEFAKPEKYLRAVLERLSECAQAHGNAEVCLGITGKGSYPHFKITYRAGSQNPDQLFGKYIDSGTPFTDASLPETAAAWSTRSNTLTEVTAVVNLIEKGLPDA